eukprot:1749-Heterococcus_DN1.PRE.3
MVCKQYQQQKLTTHELSEGNRRPRGLAVCSLARHGVNERRNAREKLKRALPVSLLPLARPLNFTRLLYEMCGASVLLREIEALLKAVKRQSSHKSDLQVFEVSDPAAPSDAASQQRSLSSSSLHGLCK